MAMSSTASGTAGDIIFTNNVLAGNNSGLQSGGGLRAQSAPGSGKAGHFILTHNTITGNRGDGAGIILNLDGNTVDMYNNIIWGNLPGCVNAWEHGIIVGGTGIINAFNNNISGKKLDWATSGGNIDQDPFFVSPGHWDEQSTTTIDPCMPSYPSFGDVWVDGDYHLRGGSPCIDMAHATPPGMPVNDRDGNQRKTGRKPDMGAYEYAACFPLSPELDISVFCAQYAGKGYAFTLNYYKNPNDSNGLYWELNPETFSQVAPSDFCPTIQQNLNLPVSCAQFMGKPYSFTLNFCKNSKSSNGGLLWKMDVSTIKAKESMPLQ